MSRCTKCLEAYPKAKQWIWFIILWAIGLLAALAIAYPIKWLIKMLG